MSFLGKRLQSEGSSLDSLFRRNSVLFALGSRERTLQHPFPRRSVSIFSVSQILKNSFRATLEAHRAETPPAALKEGVAERATLRLLIATARITLVGFKFFCFWTA